MLLALIIGAAAVVAFICSFAMFLQYMREDADDDDNSKRPAGVNRVRDPTSRAGASAGGTNDDRWIYVDTRYRVGDPGHLKGFADEEAANRWFEENDPKASLSSMRSWNELDRHRTILAMLLIVVLAILWNLLAL